MEQPEGADLAATRALLLLFASALLVTLHTVFKSILVKGLQKLTKKGPAGPRRPEVFDFQNIS